MYAFDFLQVNKGKLGKHSRFSKWPENGITNNKMIAFLALTYYMGIIKKDVIASYRSIDSTLSTPFPTDMNLRTFFLFPIAVITMNM